MAGAIARAHRWLTRNSNLTLKRVKELVWSMTSEGRQNQLALERLKAKFAGRRCFVLANGPSLLRCDLTRLKNEVTICSNAQYLIWDQMGFIPDFLTVEDRLVAEDRCNELNAIEQTTKIFPRDLSYCLKKTDNTIYINFVRNHKKFPRFSPEFNRLVCWGGTVSVLNLQLAYYLGCSEIYLIGFDHEYKVPDKIDNLVITSDADDVNHIHPDYFGKGYRWHDPNLERMESAYIEARKFLDAHNVRVRNATVGGKLEVFERVDYASLFKSA